MRQSVNEIRLAGVQMLRCAGRCTAYLGTAARPERVAFRNLLRTGMSGYVVCCPGMPTAVRCLRKCLQPGPESAALKRYGRAIC